MKEKERRGSERGKRLGREGGGRSGSRRKMRIKKKEVEDEEDGIGRRKGDNVLGDGHPPIRPGNKGYMSFLYLHFTYRRSLPSLHPPPLLCSGST